MDFIINILILGIKEDYHLTVMFIPSNKDLSVGNQFFIGKLLMTVNNVILDNGIIHYVATSRETLTNKTGITLQAIYSKINHTTLTTIQ